MIAVVHLVVEGLISAVLGVEILVEAEPVGIFK
jgi:hypothetical protein